ncbi:hypothetical protein KUD97_00600 [Desulfovibrio desulfuricans]|uniref:hypothetical protein n=1 Tax=Desulfovibrio desulfuricans TaxID=876 RepID=UPI001F1793E9|nr:hypothetical protein [Desulfovibrio desulfuricans]UIB00213.1 hypothetical protein KUD97_00600 [Desulfovibrio desulfuricans]
MSYELKKIHSSSGDGREVAFLKLAGARRRRWLVLGEFAKYAFCGLKRKRRGFERSVLKYVSIKIPALTHSGLKSRVCINQPDRLTHPARTLYPPFVFSPCLSAFIAFSAFHPGPPSKAGREVAFLKLAGARRRRRLVLGEFAKYAFCGLKRKRRDFERSVLKYVSIKIPALTHSGRKSRVCVNQPDRLTHPATKLFPPFLTLPALPCAAGLHLRLTA